MDGAADDWGVAVGESLGSTGGSQLSASLAVLFVGVVGLLACVLAAAL